MDRTSSFVPMPENANIFRKPGTSIRERGGLTSKSAFSDLSNRVPAFRPGTPRKTAFTGKPLTFHVPQDKQENYDSTLFTHSKATEKETYENDIKLVTSDKTVEDASSQKNSTTNIENAQVGASKVINSNESTDYPEPESIFKSNQDDLDLYASLSSPNVRHKSFDSEEAYDFAEELYVCYPYKDAPEFGLRLTPVVETEMSMFAESVYSGGYLGT